MNILDYDFVQNALISMVLLSVLSGIVGTYIVVRRMVFAAGGITHASFGGIGIAYFLGLSPTLGALCFGVLTSVCIELLHSREQVREDSAIAMLWSVGMAIGIIFMYISPGYGPNLMGYLFGDVLTIDRTDLVAEGTVAGLTLLLCIIFYRPLLHVSFDSAFARLTGLPVKSISLACAVIVALSISLAIKAVGIVLVLSVFTIPQTIAGLYTNSLGKQMLLSGLIALMGCLVGLFVAFAFDMPAGAVTTGVLSLCLLIIKLSLNAKNKTS